MTLVDTRSGSIISLRGMEAHHDEVMRLVEAERFFGTGIGWIDAHLIASAMLSKAKLFTLDKKLHSVVSALRLGRWQGCRYFTGCPSTNVDMRPRSKYFANAAWICAAVTPS